MDQMLASWWMLWWDVGHPGPMFSNLLRCNMQWYSVHVVNIQGSLVVQPTDGPDSKFFPFSETCNVPVQNLKTCNTWNWFALESISSSKNRTQLHYIFSDWVNTWNWFALSDVELPQWNNHHSQYTPTWRLDYKFQCTIKFPFYCIYQNINKYISCTWSLCQPSSVWFLFSDS